MMSYLSSYLYDALYNQSVFLKLSLYARVNHNNIEARKVSTYVLYITAERLGDVRNICQIKDSIFRG
jgi:hypothetical protein